VTKYRRSVFDDDILRLGVTPKDSADFEAGLREFNGEATHVHPLATYPPKIPVPAFVNSLKGVSARIFRSQHTRRGRTGFHGRRRTSPRRAGRVPVDQPAVNRAAAMPGLTARPRLTRH
jgi:REP element-mobilizing transposase RayT